MVPKRFFNSRVGPRELIYMKRIIVNFIGDEQVFAWFIGGQSLEEEIGLMLVKVEIPYIVSRNTGCT